MLKKISLFAIAVALQLLILVMVPGRQVYTRMTGRTITIKTAPVDPYDFLSGYHVVLNYDISRPAELGESFNNLSESTVVYVLLEEGDDGIFNAVSIHKEMPEDPAPDLVVIKGKYYRNRIRYGIESYYIPEKNRQQIESSLRQNARQAKAVIKVDLFGHAALIQLIVNDTVYEY